MCIDSIRFQEAVNLFNRGEFFECHEVLEDLWRPLPFGLEKTFLQGLLQVGVGFHHWRNGNLAGAQSLLESGLQKLTAVAEITPDWQPLSELPLFLEECRERLAKIQQGNAPDSDRHFPRILI